MVYFNETNQAVLEGVVADWSEAPPDICLISSEGHPVYTQVLEIAFLAAKQLLLSIYFSLHEEGSTWTSLPPPPFFVAIG